MPTDRVYGVMIECLGVETNVYLAGVIWGCNNRPRIYNLRATINVVAAGRSFEPVSSELIQAAVEVN